MGTCSGPAWEPRTRSVPTHLAGSPGGIGIARGRKHPGQRPPAAGTPRSRGTHAPPPQALPGTSKNSTTPRGVLNTRGAPNPSRPQPHVLLGTWGGPGTAPPLSPPRCSGGPALPGGPSPHAVPPHDPATPPALTMAARCPNRYGAVEEGGGGRPVGPPQIYPRGGASRGRGQGEGPARLRPAPPGPRGALDTPSPPRLDSDWPVRKSARVGGR